jgi:hypothetical protein
LSVALEFLAHDDDSSSAAACCCCCLHCIYSSIVAWVLSQDDRKICLLVVC